jgi:hypothetical protein
MPLYTLYLPAAVPDFLWRLRELLQKKNTRLSTKRLISGKGRRSKDGKYEWRTVQPGLGGGRSSREISGQRRRLPLVSQLIFHSALVFFGFVSRYFGPLK